MPKPYSDGSPRFEDSTCSISNFYIYHKARTINLESERIFRLFEIPRHAEVIEGKVCVIAGEYNNSNSELYKALRT